MGIALPYRSPIPVFRNTTCLRHDFFDRSTKVNLQTLLTGDFEPARIEAESLEVLALRQQVAVLKRKRTRPH